MGMPELPKPEPSFYYKDDPLDNLAVLFQAQVAMIEDAKASGGVPAFRLGLFFADVLDCFGLLDLENLTKVMGYKAAVKVWNEVKPNGRKDKPDCVQ